MSKTGRSASLLALCLAVAWVFSLVWKPAPPPPFAGLAALTIPDRLPSGFQLQQEQEIDATTRAALSSGEVRSFLYVDSTQTPMELSLISGTDRSALHDPRSCLTGSGWRIDKDRPYTLPNTSVTARRCEIVDDARGARMDVVYLYVVDGQPIASVTQIRTRMLLGAVIGKRNVPVYFIRCLSPIKGTAGVSESLPEAGESQDSLGRFVSELWPVLGLAGKS